MKANAPEKIYINDFGSELSYDWHTEHCCENDIEYTRTDAFIEKTIAWLNETLRNTDFYENEIELMIKDFEKYMKGE